MDSRNVSVQSTWSSEEENGSILFNATDLSPHGISQSGPAVAVASRGGSSIEITGAAVSGHIVPADAGSGIYIYIGKRTYR